MEDPKVERNHGENWKFREANNSDIFVATTLGVKSSDGNYVDIDVQNPLPTDGDSVYAKDLDLVNSDIGNFTGEVKTLFDDYNSSNVAASVGSGGANPKSFTVVLQRPVGNTTIGLASADSSISNVKITLKDLVGNTVKIIDNSADNTKRGVQVFQYEQKYFREVLVEFYTDDEVSISGMAILKSINVSIDAINGVVSDGNSTNTPLIANDFFLGEAIDTKNYGSIIVSVLSDVVSAVDGLQVEFAETPSGTWYPTDNYTITSSETDKLKTFGLQTVLRFMRIRYTNGASGQTTFLLSTQLKPVYVRPTSHRVGDSISAEDDSELVKSVLSGKDQNSVFQNVRATEVGNLMTANFLVEVSRGNIPGYFITRKFGYNPAVTTATGDVYEWGQTAGAYNYTFSADGVADIDRLSSDDNTDTQSIVIEGLDINGDEVIQTIDLTGQTPVALTTSLWRVNRTYNDNGTATIGNVYVFVDGATTAGVPNDVTSVRGYFSVANQQTLQAIYTVPNGKTAYFYVLRPSIVKKQAAFAIFTAKIREFGKIARTQDLFALTTTGTSKANDASIIPIPIPAKSDFIPSVDPDSTIGFSVSYQMLLIDN